MDIIGSGYWPPPPGSPRGSQSVDLSGDAPGSLTQTVKTAPGSSYLLKWYAAGNPECGQSPKVMHVVWDQRTDCVPHHEHQRSQHTRMGWSLKSQVVMASSALSVLVFADATPDQSACGAVVADVSLTAEQS